MRTTLIVALLLATAVPVSPMVASESEKTLGQMVREQFLAEAGMLPATTVANGVEVPFEVALGVLDSVMAPTTNGVVAPGKDIGIGVASSTSVCAFGAYAYTSVSGISTATTPPDSFANLATDKLVPGAAPNPCYGANWIGTASGDVAATPSGFSRFSAACVIGAGNTFLNSGTPCISGAGTTAFASAGVVGNTAVYGFKGCFAWGGGLYYCYNYTYLFSGFNTNMPSQLNNKVPAVVSLA